MSVAQIVVNIMLIIVSLIMIVTVLLQSSESGGLSALSGTSESYFGKNKNKSFEGKLALATKISAGVFIVLALSMIFIH